MEEESERLCQTASPSDEPCDYLATVHCAKCGRWFCDAHAEDEEWHPCMLSPSDEGGEAKTLARDETVRNSLRNARLRLGA